MIVAMWIFGLLTLLSACGVVASKKSLNSALCLVATLFFVAVHFALLGADFLAALQILIYAGAIMILVVFVIMLLGLQKDADREAPSVPSVFAAIFVALLFGILSFVIRDETFDVNFASYFVDKVQVASETQSQLSSDLPLASQEGDLDTGSAEESDVLDSGGAAMGRLLIESYLFPFQLSALLLLSAVIGAVSLAYQPKRPLLKGRGLSAMKQKFPAEEVS